jgi:hypothetical protein
VRTAEGETSLDVVELGIRRGLGRIHIQRDSKQAD